MEKTVSYYEASANLRKAAELLSKHGLCQYDFAREGKICLVESITRAITGQDPSSGGVFQRLASVDTMTMEDRPEVARVLAAAGAPLTHGSVNALCELNNRDGQTTEKLIALLNKAADEPEKKAAA